MKLLERLVRGSVAKAMDEELRVEHVLTSRAGHLQRRAT